MKEITLIGYCRDSLENYTRQIDKLYNQQIGSDIIIVDELEDIDSIDSKIVLIPSFLLVDNVQTKLKDDTSLLIYNRSLTTKSINILKSINPGSHVNLVDENKFMAEKLCGVIHELGINHLHLIPSEKESINPLYSSIYVTCSQSQNNNDISLNQTVLDIDTIMEIGMRLGMDPTLINKELLKDYVEYETPKTGLHKLFRKLNKYESSILILFDVLSNGYMEIGLDKNLYYCNDDAVRILGLEKNNYTHIPIENFIDKKIIDDVFEDKKKYKNEIITINDESIILSIYPNVNSGKFFGATAFIHQFSEAERVQDEIRKKVIEKGHKAKYTFDRIIGQSQEIQECISMARKISNSDASVVIEGETGTGKELFAQAIHNNSRRKNSQFVAINCGALPAEILESELFGYAEGAFTGARKGGKTGLFELGHNGTVFLDEIGEMPLNLQTKLLRVLQEQEIRKIGSDTVKKINVRIIAATNKDLESEVAKGEFRQDLFYRLKVLPLYVPPLRNRNIDIILIHDYYKKELGGTYALDDNAQNTLLRHNWAGNVRELRNFVEFFISLDKDIISDSDIPIRKERPVKNMTGTYDKFIKKTGNELGKYVRILEIFHKSYINKQRIGRRSICQELQESNIFVTEQEIRRIIKEMEEMSIVSVGKGRKGSQISEYGIQLLKTLKDKNHRY